MVKSSAFSPGVSAQSLKWNSDGRMKAYGVIASAPTIAINSVSLSPNESVNAEINVQRSALFRFLQYFLFVDRGQSLYNRFSRVV